MILDFLRELSSDNKGVTLLLLWLAICIVIFIVFILICKVMNIIYSIQRDAEHKREIKLKRNIYHRYAEIADGAKKHGLYPEAALIMSECVRALFGTAPNAYLNENTVNGVNENDAITDESNGTGAVKESVSEQSRQGFDRLSDTTEESFVKITD